MITDKIEELAKRICAEKNVQFYDLEMKRTHIGNVLRVYITNPDGVKVHDCTAVSRALNEELDIIDLIAAKYYLEVSSPGLERSLNRLDHYRLALKETVKVTHRNSEGKTITTIGVLETVSPEEITVALESGDEKEEIKIAMNSIKKARTVYTF